MPLERDASGIVGDASGIPTQPPPGAAILPAHPFHSTAKTRAERT